MSGNAPLAAGCVARWWGMDFARSITSHTESISAAMWRFDKGPVCEVEGRSDESTDVIAMPITGAHHHTYFGDGRQKWSGRQAPYQMNIITAGETPRDVFSFDSPFTYLHVYLPHAVVDRLAETSSVLERGAKVRLIDPMCSRDPHVESVCRRIVREMMQPDRVSKLLVDFLGQELAVYLLRHHSDLSGSPQMTHRYGPGYRDWRLRRAMEYLEAHIAENVGLEDLASEVGLSTTHLANLFRAGTGDPPHRWLMRRRFEQACELLAKPHLSVTEIAYQCGFASSQHLATVMRRELHTTPTAYRRALLE